MLVQHSDVIEKNYMIAKEYIGITKEGKVDVKNKESLILEDQILLYLIGKLYSERAELSSTHKVSRQELLNELGISENSIGAIIKRLKDKKLVISTKQGVEAFFEIKKNEVEKTLKRLNS